MLMWKRFCTFYSRGVQPCNTAGPNAHDQIGPQAIAACVNLCVWDHSLATHGRLAMSLLNLDLSTDHKTSALGPLLARGPPVAHCCFRVLRNAQKLFVVLSFSFHLKRSSSWCCRGKAKDAARSCGGGELPRLVFFFPTRCLSCSPNWRQTIRSRHAAWRRPASWRRRSPWPGRWPSAWSWSGGWGRKRASVTRSPPRRRSPMTTGTRSESSKATCDKQTFARRRVFSSE